eukprot:snap_masked-scaffold_23-processed-gene-4.21-mRNA-1 protein AED:1.00 eAED:1.00 QI:0/0/0/0/1/1/2/0/59
MNMCIARDMQCFLIYLILFKGGLVEECNIKSVIALEKCIKSTIKCFGTRLTQAKSLSSP